MSLVQLRLICVYSSAVWSYKRETCNDMNQTSHHLTSHHITFLRDKSLPRYVRPTKPLSPTPLWYPMDYPWQLYSVSDVTAANLTAAAAKLTAAAAKLTAAAASLTAAAAKLTAASAKLTAAAAKLTAAAAAVQSWLPRWTRVRWRCPPSPSYTRKPFQSNPDPASHRVSWTFGMWGPCDYLTLFHRNFSPKIEKKIFVFWTQKLRATRSWKICIGSSLPIHKHNVLGINFRQKCVVAQLPRPQAPRWVSWFRISLSTQQLIFTPGIDKVVRFLEIGDE